MTQQSGVSDKVLFCFKYCWPPTLSTTSALWAVSGRWWGCGDCWKWRVRLWYYDSPGSSNLHHSPRNNSSHFRQILLSISRCSQGLNHWRVMRWYKQDIFPFCFFLFLFVSSSQSMVDKESNNHTKFLFLLLRLAYPTSNNNIKILGTISVQV